MKHPITLYREKYGLSKSDLARRASTSRAQITRLEQGGEDPKGRTLTLVWATRLAKAIGHGVTPQDLMFPEIASIDIDRFNNVFEVAEAGADIPQVAFEREFLSKLLPSAARHRLRLMMVEANQANDIVSKGDAVVIDLDDNTPNRPGLYAIEIAGQIQWRILSPTTSGDILVQGPGSLTAQETVKPHDLKTIGRARLRISTL